MLLAALERALEASRVGRCQRGCDNNQQYCAGNCSQNSFHQSLRPVNDKDRRAARFVSGRDRPHHPASAIAQFSVCFSKRKSAASTSRPSSRNTRWLAANPVVEDKLLPVVRRG